jgi:hypothetical protein
MNNHLISDAMPDNAPRTLEDVVTRLASAEAQIKRMNRRIRWVEELVKIQARKESEARKHGLSDSPNW